MNDAIVEDSRAVDPIAYIRAIGLRPEDSYGFLPLNVHDRTSFFFLYRDRPEYARARVALPAAESITTVDIGVAGFGIGHGRQVDVDIPAEKPGGRTGDLIAQALAMQQAYGGMAPGGQGDSEAARMAQLEGLRASGVLPEELYEQATYGVQGGHAGPNPGGVPAAAAPPDAPPLVAHRLYPRLYKRRSGDQFDDFIPRYRDALRLCPEDVYGVFPRHTRTGHAQSGDITAWEDYWLVYRDRQEYASGRDAWAEEMDEPSGFSERIFSSMMKGSWPDAEVVPGVADPGTATFDGGKVEVKKDGWPRELLIRREKGPDLGDELRGRISRWDYAPEDSFGLCPDFNSNSIFFAWRSE